MPNQAAGSVGASRLPAEASPGAVDDLRSRVTFSRMDPSDCGQRQVFVKLDDSRRLALVYGEAFTEDVTPGLHRLRVHNTLFWKTLTFAIEPGEHLECIIVNRARWWTAGMAGVFGSAPLFLTVRLTSLR